MKSFSRLLLCLASVGGVSTALACSECGCSLSSDWAAQGYGMLPGFEAGLRYEYFDQSVLRSGTGSVNRAALTFPNESEIQQHTVNRNTWLDLNYGVGSSWAFVLSAPYHDRFHTTIAAGDMGVSTSQASGLGDVRLLVRYQRPGLRESLGFQFGLKLPTGNFTQNFAAGPQAGNALDRGLQLGTGTTDLLVNASWFRRLAPEWSLFAQVQVDQPLAARDGFVPGTSAGFNSGIRWLNTGRITPQLQVNLKAESREHGPNADTANSGGVFAYLSPGVTAEVTENASAFAFVQVPVYQRVNGLQLEPKWLLSFGLRWKL
jgi:hypothetical protein